MPYAAVRSALLVGKTIAVEAAKHVQTLSIMKESEMYIPAARRFANAEVVNILCLLEGTGERDEAHEIEFFEEFTISETASTRTPTFISSFPKLKSSFLGGVLLQAGQANKVRYDRDECVGPDNHRDIFRSLVRSLFGAFKTGALRREVELIDLAWSLRDAWSCAEDSRDSDTNPCQRCRNCIQYLPLEDIIYASVYKQTALFCLNADIIWRFLLERPGIEMGIKCISEKFLCQVVQLELDTYQSGKIVEESESAFKHLWKKWRLDTQMSIQVWFLPESAYEKLDGLMKRGLEPAQIRFEYFFQQMGSFIGGQIQFHVWSKSTVEELAARGFPVDCDSIPVIEDRPRSASFDYM
jgi:hypothetical protein